MYYYSCYDGEYEITVESEIPLSDPCNGKDGKAVTGNQPVLGGVEGGLLPFGIANILPKWLADDIKRLLLIAAIIAAIVLAIMLTRKRK